MRPVTTDEVDGTCESGGPQWRHRHVLVGAMATLFAFAALTVLTLLRWLDAADAAGHEWALTERTAHSVAIAQTVTSSGPWIVALGCALIATLLLVSSGHAPGRVAVLVVGGVEATLGARLALSYLVHRSRPPVHEWAGPAGGYSFPSGHTTAATLAATVLCTAVISTFRSRSARALAVVLAIIWAASVGWSRVWLGVHWPSDVLAGWCLGASAGLLIWLLVRRLAAPAGNVREAAGRDPDQPLGPVLDRQI